MGQDLHEHRKPNRKAPRIGLALSGGGIKGLAHLGVLRALKEQTITIDYLAGTSMGGIVAGAYAAGVPLDRLAQAADEIKILDLASPDRSWRGFFDQRKLSRLLADLLGGNTTTFGDLQIPVAVVATDLTTGELVVLKEGPLIPALLATAALPLFFAPVEHQDRWLIDGGVLNNAPFDIVRRMGAERVLAVTFSSAMAPPTAPNPVSDDRGPSLRVLKRLRSFAPEWRQPFLIAEAGIGLMQKVIDDRRMQCCPPDALLTIEMEETGLFTFDAGRAAVDAGYRAAKESMGEIAKLTDPLPPPWQRRLKRSVQRVAQAWRDLRRPAYSLFPDA